LLARAECVTPTAPSACPNGTIAPACRLSVASHHPRRWTMKRLLIAVAAIALATASAFAQSQPQPPPNGMKLSQVIAKVETRDKFAYVSEISWSTSGYYDIVYQTSDKAKVEIKIDPVSGEAK